MAFYEWIIPDKNGDEIKLGKKVDTVDGIGTVTGLYRVEYNRYWMHVSFNDGEWSNTYTSDYITLVKPKETFDDIVKEAVMYTSIGEANAREIGKRFLACEEASHE